MNTEDWTGRTLGRCRLLHKVGTGSMGVVYEGFHSTLEIPVAVKVLRAPPLEIDQATWRERLRREAQFAARLNHPGLVRVLDYGDEAGASYIVMEFVRGQTLEDVLRARDPVGEHLALRILGQIATAIQVAHQAGIVHRDLKPANILVGTDGNLKVADLGLARDPLAASITRPSDITGTPHYMAPETLDGSASPDHRVDLYAMGVILYRMLFCCLPFSGTLHQVLVGHMNGHPDWTVPEGQRISPGTLYLVRRLLEKWPTKRLQSSIEVIQACREQLARLDSRDRVEAESVERNNRAKSSSGTRLAHNIRERLRAETILRDGRTILHASSRERLIAWTLLCALLLLAVAGILRR